MSDAIKILRDGSVLLGGEAIGRVHGEARNWGFTLADYREHPGTPDSGWHSKQDAAEMCAQAHRGTPLRPAPSATTEALLLARARLRTHLAKVRELAARGNIPAARMVAEDVMSDLDDIQGLIDAPVIPVPGTEDSEGG